MTLKEFFKGDRFAVLAGCELTEIREGYARATMHPHYEHEDRHRRIPRLGISCWDQSREASPFYNIGRSFRQLL